MEGFRVLGGEKIEGEVCLQGAKNAVLPILAAALLPEGGCAIRSCPDIRDVRAMAQILDTLGCLCRMENGEMQIDNSGLCRWEMPEGLSKQIRSSVFLLGPILAKMRRATVPYPGGCEIGLRPIDLHGARVTARDLRGEAALVIAGLAARGETLVENAGIIDRGYARMEDTLRRLGARIDRVREA